MKMKFTVGIWNGRSLWQAGTYAMLKKEFERLMYARFKGYPRDIIVIVAYALTTNHSDDEVETFYKQVSLFRRITLVLCFIASVSFTCSLVDVAFFSVFIGTIGVIHATLSTLGTSISECQKQVFKQNETLLIVSVIRALWAVDQERKDEKRRASNRSSMNFENRWVLRSALNFASDGEVVREVAPETKKVFINHDLSKRQAEQAFLKRQERRLIKSTVEKSSKLNNDQPFRLNK
ncbi:hypothetical protein HELRODRAFT_169120 [Helobdella robusta]|uniref:Uncharacterized protein n=1 Tax=Helobdella robusta TaxID=6412 RepID=T1F1F6_HELRO|nr:hypothetical protein HELRODRAFT_169120 [Helobdella robusta]ESO08315.1 hypothetical protein HELRODRAFT_169120 [Helobdella robusta]